MSDDQSPSEPIAEVGARRLDEVEITAADKGNRAPRREARIELCRRMLANGYGPAAVIGWLTRATADKDWMVSQKVARDYLNRALETFEDEVVRPRVAKQARTRAMFTLVFQRAMALAADPLTKGKAGYLNAAISAADKIARIDGSYTFDGSSMLPPAVQAATPDDAVRIVNHAQATIELMQRRGIAAAKPAAVVIDAESTESAEPDEQDTDTASDAN